MRHGITENALRTALKRDLASTMAPEDALLEELNVELGAVRADVVLAGDLLHAFEIKSDFDTLDRLARQMHAYHRVFDRVTLATTQSFMTAAELLLPPWWGLLLAEELQGSLVLTSLRAPSPNPRQNVRDIASLLWREEALAVVEVIAPHRVRSRSTREELCDVIAGAGTLVDVRRWVVSGLKRRNTIRALQGLSLRRASTAA